MKLTFPDGTTEESKQYTKDMYIRTFTDYIRQFDDMITETEAAIRACRKHIRHVKKAKQKVMDGISDISS